MRKLWGLLYRTIKVLSDPRSTSMNICMSELWKVRKALQEQTSDTENTGIASATAKAKEMLDNYLRDSYLWLSISMMLDPRFKIRVIPFLFEGVFGSNALEYVDRVRKAAQELFDEYSNHAEHSGAHRNSENNNTDTERVVYEADPFQEWDRYINSTQHNEQRSKKECNTELEKYLEESGTPRSKDVGILNWCTSVA